MQCALKKLHILTSFSLLDREDVALSVQDVLSICQVCFVFCIMCDLTAMWLDAAATCCNAHMSSF